MEGIILHIYDQLANNNIYINLV